MQRHEMMTAMTELGLKGMAGAFDEAVATGLAHSTHPVAALASAQRALAEAFLNAPASSLSALKPLLQGAADRDRVDQEQAERAAQIPRLRGIRGSGVLR